MRTAGTAVRISNPLERHPEPPLLASLRLGGQIPIRCVRCSTFALAGLGASVARARRRCMSARPTTRGDAGARATPRAAADGARSARMSSWHVRAPRDLRCVVGSAEASRRSRSSRSSRPRSSPSIATSIAPPWTRAASRRAARPARTRFPRATCPRSTTTAAARRSTLRRSGRVSRRRRARSRTRRSWRSRQIGCKRRGRVRPRGHPAHARRAQVRLRLGHATTVSD